MRRCRLGKFCLALPQNSCAAPRYCNVYHRVSQARTFQSSPEVTPLAASDVFQSQEEVDALQLKQITRNARTLIRARRVEDAERIVDEGLEMFPWNSALWFWKISTKIRDSRGVLEVWDTMTRMGVEKRSEHYDMMASALARADARHFLVDLFYETLEQDLVVNPKFYAAVFFICSDGTNRLLKDGEQIWKEMTSRSQFAHIQRDQEVVSRYNYMASRLEELQESVRERPTTAGSYFTVPTDGNAETVSADRRSDHESPDTRSVQASTSPEIPAVNCKDDERLPTDPADAQSGDTQENSTKLNSTAEFQRNSPKDSPGEASVTTSAPGSLREPASIPSPTSLPASVSPSAISGPSIQQQTFSESETLPNVVLREELETFFGRDKKRRAEEHRRALQTARKILREKDSGMKDYRYVVRSAALLGQPEDLMDLLEESIEKGLKPDVTFYNPIIRSFFAKGKPDEALALIDRMDISNVPYDYRTILVILRGLFANDRVDTALQFFVDLFRQNSDMTLMPAKDEAILCFNTVIEGLCHARNNRLADAQKLVAVMIERGLEPGLSTYKPLIRASFYNKLSVDAMKYYDLALKIHDPARHGLNWKEDLDMVTSTVVSGFLMDDRYAEAENLMNIASKKGHWHSTVSRPFVYFIRWLAQKERIDEAWNLFNFHRDKPYGPQSMCKLYSAVLIGIYLERGDLPGGLSWFRRMEHECEQLEQIPYEVLVQRAMMYGDRETGEAIWREALNFIYTSGQVMHQPLQRLGDKWNLNQLT